MNNPSKTLFYSTLTILALSCAACSAGSAGLAYDDTAVRDVRSDRMAYMTTDKALYAPGETVKFTIDSVPAEAVVRYRHGADVVYAEPLKSSEWTWVAPADDFNGYLVDVCSIDGDTETIYGTIAVDVSSDWGRFPRYGFVATYDSTKLAEGVIEAETEFLNRCHINGIQYYDWHNMHHHPLGGKPGELMEEYTDIGNRQIITEVVKRYIDAHHERGMNAMFYNLCFGVLSDADTTGIDPHWYIFKDQKRADRDVMTLGPSWKSNIYLVDPGNAEWQKFIGDRNEEVYEALDFDGYHIDQLGRRGDVYDYDGNPVDLPAGYASFIEAMKARRPDKRLVMNSVASFGADNIASTGDVDFCYNEVWGDEDQFADLYEIIKANDRSSDNSLSTVFAAYMNYDLAHHATGYMNTPGVLLTDAVIMALGGDHLELGDHMLSREYFCAAPLAMTDELRQAIIHYYDFMTAYQNLLRGTSSASAYEPVITAADTSLITTNWPPQEGSITVFAKNAGNRSVINLLNFRGIDNLNWRDLEGTRQAPEPVSDFTLTVDHPQKVKSVWVASPDRNGGAPQRLDFEQTDGKVTVTVPSLDYWTMLVFEN